MAADGNPEVNLETGNYPGEEVQGVGEREMGFTEREIFLRVELYADEENDSTEVKRKKRMARAALTLWREKIEILEKLKLQKGSEMRSIMNEVYQLVSLYSVFVGVVLTSVATSTRLGCQHLWSPVSLSLVAHYMLVTVAFTKFREIRESQIIEEYSTSSLRDIQRWVYSLKSTGYADFDFDFDRDCQDRPFRRRSVPFWRSALGLLVPLTIFTVLLVVSLLHILCGS